VNYGLPDCRQSLCAVGLEHEASAAQAMHWVVHWPPQLCSVDVHPVMQPMVLPWHPLIQLLYASLHVVAHEAAFVRHDGEVLHGT
jgi:hypothetical protein